MLLLRNFLFSNVDHFRKIDCQISKKCCQISLPVQSQWNFEINLTSQISKKCSRITPVSEKRSLKCLSHTRTTNTRVTKDKKYGHIVSMSLFYGRATPSVHGGSPLYTSVTTGRGSSRASPGDGDHHSDRAPVGWVDGKTMPVLASPLYK